MSARQDRIAKMRKIWASVSWEDIAAFIGPGADVYKPTWEKNNADIIKQGYAGFSFSWHWPALIPLLGIPWAAARRQWVFVAMMVGAIILISVIAAFFEHVNFGYMMFLVPIMAKGFYVQTAVGKISKIKETVSNVAEQTAAIKMAGGLNMTYGYIAAAISFAILGLSIFSLFLES